MAASMAEQRSWGPKSARDQKKSVRKSCKTERDTVLRHLIEHARKYPEYEMEFALLYKETVGGGRSKKKDVFHGYSSSTSLLSTCVKKMKKGELKPMHSTVSVL